MRNRLFVTLTVLGLTLTCGAAVMAAPSAASDACSPRLIRTEARVSVSDGSKYTANSYFHTTDAAALQQIGESSTSTIALEGPFGWTNENGNHRLGGDKLKSFALGHQFHALILHFSKIVQNAHSTDKIPVEGGTRSGIAGDWPYGGTVQLIYDTDGKRPEALRLAPADLPELFVTFHDWRRYGEHFLPFEIRIDDGSRVFIYLYSDIAIGKDSPLWFEKQVEAPNLDPVRIYRLHRRVLAAHCAGNAQMVAAAAAPDQINIAKGEVSRASQADLETLFADVFQRLSYAEYHDLMPPVIEVSQSGDMGWLTAAVRPVGTVTQTGNAFDDRWSWLMTVRKIDGSWKIKAISASRAP